MTVSGTERFMTKAGADGSALARSPTDIQSSHEPRGMGVRTIGTILGIKMNLWKKELDSTGMDPKWEFLREITII